MTGREEMLRQIREALGVQREPGVSPPLGEFPPLGPVLLPIEPDNLVPKFEAELRAVAGNPYRVASREQLDRLFRDLLKGSRPVVLSRNPLLSQLGLANKFRAWGLEVSVWPSRATTGTDAAQRFRACAFQAEAGITGVDFALAETGSLVLSSVTEGSQLASLAPPVHIALYRRCQVVASLDEVLERASGARSREAEDPGRSIVLVTGTSRTADIEQILIRGVHGPREVHAILVEESCLGEGGSP